MTPTRFVRTLGTLGSALAGLLLSGGAAAHEPYEITADARLFADSLDLSVTMASATAAMLCPELRSDGGDHRIPERATPCIQSFYVLSADAQPLSPGATSARWTTERDLEVHVRYPAPAFGRVRFDASLLRRLGDPAYGSLLTVTSAERFYGQTLLRVGEPSFEIWIPRSVPPSQPRRAHQGLTSGSFFRRYKYLVVAVAVLVVAAVVLLLRRERAKA